MDDWPTDDRDTAHPSTNGKRPRKALSDWTYPVVEHGSLSAATLRRTHQRLEWSFIAQDSCERTLMPIWKPVQVFPESLRRPIDNDMSVVQRADQGVQFLRTYYPDFEMYTDLVREEITTDVHASQTLREFDPYLGSMLETFTCSRKAERSLTCLAFPMGESYLDLNISPLAYSRRRNVRLDAVAKPIRSFQTPIQQIKASAPQLTEDEDYVAATVIGIRTMASTSLLDIRPTSDEATSVEARELINVIRSDVSDCPVMDMTIPATDRTTAIVINSIGNIYRCSVPGGTKTLELLNTVGTDDNPSANDEAWRLAAWDGEDSCLAASGRSAHFIDFRKQDNALDLYGVPPGVALTSVEAHQKDRLIRLVTTRELLWLDVRSPNKPLLGVRHGRDSDRTLRSQTRIIGNVPVTFLTSRRNGLVSVYDVARSGAAIRMSSPAYSLPRLRTPDDGNLGHVFIQHPHITNPGDLSLSVLQLSELGAIHMLHLKLPDDTQDRVEECLMNRNWSDEVEELEEQVQTSELEVGPLGARTFTEANLRPAYERVFMTPTTRNQSDVVYDLLEKMPRFWQEAEGPAEHVLTTFDIAYRSGPEPPNASRNDLFTESVLNSKRGYRALRKGRLPIQDVARRAPWHLNITPFIQRRVPDLQGKPSATIARLSRYDLAADGRRPAQSLRRETEAREQLALDLHMSSDIYSTSRFRKPAELDINEAVETMSRATEAMTLGEMEPSDVQFGFLHPLRKESQDHYFRDEDGQKDAASEHLAPLGVRLLLKEWDVGVDPSTYRYDDPYGVAHPKSTVPRYTRNPPTRLIAQIKEHATQSQRPPLVVSTVNLAPPAIVSSQTFGARAPFPATQVQRTRSDAQQHATEARSQPTDNWDMHPSSQIPFASTQIVPGPYGGRPGLLKKKPTKKRIGGF